MEQVLLSVSDKFYEIGNRLFNVSDLEYNESYDLSYESTDDTSFNKAFISFENKSKDINSVIMKLVISIYEFLFIKKEQLTVIGSSDSIFMPIIKLNKPNCANSVIHNNVRNRLLLSINEGINKTNKVEKTSPKKRYKLKNQFINTNKPTNENQVKGHSNSSSKMIQILKNLIENSPKLLNNFKQINLRT